MNLYLDYTKRRPLRKKRTIVVDVPGSKSETARYLVLNALSRYQAKIHNPSTSDDTWAMRRSISQLQHGGFVNTGEAGTVYRLVTALAAINEGRECFITGSDYLLSRPLSPLIDALKALGADIEYTPGEPVRVKGKRLRGGEVLLDSGVSSQFVSALMLIGPLCEEGLHIRFRDSGATVSWPYIHLTAMCISQYGIDVDIADDGVKVWKGEFRSPKDVNISADWSGASYILATVSLLDDPWRRVIIPNLWYDGNIQGDRECLRWFEDMGLTSSYSFRPSGLEIKVGESVAAPEEIELDFTATPDLFPTMAVYYCLKGVHYRMTGLKNLRLKESDRIMAVKEGLQRCGYVTHDSGEEFIWRGERCDSEKVAKIDTYSDHRIAMSFALMSLSRPVEIEGAEHVCKSYPGFFESFRHIID